MVAAAAQEEGDEPWWAVFDDENASPAQSSTKQQLLQAYLNNKNRDMDMEAQYVQSGIVDLLKDLSSTNATSSKSPLELLQSLHKALHPPSHSSSTGEMTIAALVLTQEDTPLQIETVDMDEVEFLPDSVLWQTMVTWLLQLYEHCRTAESSSSENERPFKRARLERSSTNAASFKIQSNHHSNSMRWKLGLAYAIASMIKKDATINLQEWMDHVRTRFSNHLELVGPHIITAGVALAAWQQAETCSDHNIPLSQLVPRLTSRRYVLLE